MLFLIDKKLVISFFVFQLPLFPIIPTDFKLFSLIGPHEVVYGLSLFTLFNLSKHNKFKVNEVQKLSIKFIYLIFFINIYVIAKDVFLNHSKEEELSYVLKNLFRLFLYYYSLVLLIKIIYTDKVQKYVIVGIKYSLVVLVISMVFTFYIKALDIGQVTVNKSSLINYNQTRFMGLYGAGGDVNSAGVFLAGVFGFLLALYEKTGSFGKYIVFFAFAIFGILLTGSRTSFIALSFVLIVFFIKNKSGKSKIALFFALVVFYFIFNEQFDLLFMRFFDPSAREAVDPNETGRVGKWIRYMDWILNNPKTLIYGNQIKINYNRAPHNYLIYILYHTGIVPLILFIMYFTQLIKQVKFSTKINTLLSAYYIVPFVFIMMTVNSFGSSIFLWLYLPIGALFMDYKKKKLSKSKI